MREVGAFEAKNRFGQLLDWVQQGEEITITRHGKEVARVCRPAAASIATLHVRQRSASAK